MLYYKNQLNKKEGNSEVEAGAILQEPLRNIQNASWSKEQEVKNISASSHAPLIVCLWAFNFSYAPGLNKLLGFEKVLI